MTARPLPIPAHRPHEAVPITPALPTTVLCAFKGGCFKTSIAVALAERLAFAGLHVLLVTTDEQEDARRRLGVGESSRSVERVQRGAGAVSVAGLRDAKVIDLLYRAQPSGLAGYDLAIVDTAAGLRAARLPGVRLLCPIDGTDAAENLVLALRRTPTNSSIVLARVGVAQAREWSSVADALARAVGRDDLTYLPEPLPRVAALADACDAAESFWTVPRRKGVRRFCDGLSALAAALWSDLDRDHALPPPPGAEQIYVAGWDDGAEDGD
jgi:hypothetical protein